MFLTSWLLSRSVLKGEATTFSLELPPYRPPRVLQTLYTSLIDRTLIVLWRAVVFAAPGRGRNLVGGQRPCRGGSPGGVHWSGAWIPSGCFWA